MSPILCPWLGSEHDREMRRTDPVPEHRCYVRQPPPAIEEDLQTLICLTSEHRFCFYYREPENQDPAPVPEIIERSSATTMATGVDAGASAGAGPSYLRWLQVALWTAAILVAAIVITAYILVFSSLPPETEAAAQVRPSSSSTSSPTFTATPLVTPLLTATPLPAGVVPSPTFGFVDPTASPTPRPGGAIYSLSPSAGAAGWVASDESRGNHLGDSFLYAGISDDVVYHGMWQFDLSSVPRGATIHEAVLELTGLDARRLGRSGIWEVRILERAIDDEWSRHAYQDIHNAGIQWSLVPMLGVGDLGAGKTNAFELLPQQARDLEQRLLDEHYTLSFRVDGPLTGEDNLFAWDTGYGPATEERRPRLLLNVGQPPETPIPTGTSTPTDVPTPTTTPTPSRTPEWVVIRSTATPGNVVTAAAIAVRETAWATTTGTATATPEFVATPTPPFIVITNTPAPMNRATAVSQRAEATALVILTGSPTPPPQPFATATSTRRPTATPAVIWFDVTTPTPTSTTTPVPTVPPLPSILPGNILFLSDRSGQPEVYVLDPDTERLGLVTAQWPYDLAKRLENQSPDRRSFAFVQHDDRRLPQVFIHSREYGDSRQVTFNTGSSYDPVWSPRGDRLAFVSTESGNDDIYVVSIDGQDQVRLTANQWEWDKHPSWSPDGTRIVFWSNQDSGRKQLWIMNADGSGRRLLLPSPYEDWNPVWVK